jgi:hypothetical protein
MLALAPLAISLAPWLVAQPAVPASRAERATPEPKEQAACPDGDLAGALWPLTHDSRSATVLVADGVATVIVRDELRATGPGPGQALLRLAFAPAGGVVRRVTLTTWDDPVGSVPGRSIERPLERTVEGVIAGAPQADAAFEAFVDALQFGRDEDKTGHGRPAAAVIVGHPGEQMCVPEPAQPHIEVVTPCSVRSVVLHTTLTIPASYADNGWTFRFGDGTPPEAKADADAQPSWRRHPRRVGRMLARHWATRPTAAATAAGRATDGDAEDIGSDGDGNGDGEDAGAGASDANDETPSEQHFSQQALTALSVAEEQDERVWLRVKDQTLRPGDDVVDVDDTRDKEGFFVLHARPARRSRLSARLSAQAFTPLAADAPALQVAGFVPPRNAESAENDDNDTTAAPNAADAPAAATTPLVLARLEVELPRPLADAPAGLHLVFVVDQSVSFGTARLAKALALVAGVLDAAPPDASAALVTFARRPRLVVPFQPRSAGPLLTDAAAAALPLENGSDLGGALRFAAALTSDLPPGAVGRIVMVTDAELSFAQAEAFTAAKAPSALVHLLRLGQSMGPGVEARWQRVFASGNDDAGEHSAGDDADLSSWEAFVPLVERSGGIWVELDAARGGGLGTRRRATARTDGGDEESELTLLPHLIRPTRLDRPRWAALRGAPTDEDEEGDTRGPRLLEVFPLVDGREAWSPSIRSRLPPSLPVRLHEGEELTLHALLPKLPRGDDAALVAFAWSSTVRLAPTMLRGEARAARLALVANGRHDVPDDIIRAAAVSTHAVTPETALVHVPDFAPPAPELGGLGAGGFGCGCGCGTRCGGAFGHRRGIGLITPAPPAALLRRLVREAYQGCALPIPEAPGATLATLEVWRRELLAVDAPPCVAEALWQARLDRLGAGLDLNEHVRHVVRRGP